VAEPDRDVFMESLMETNLYSIGAYFLDRHPDLVDEVLAQAEAIEAQGLERYASGERVGLDEAFQTLITGLAVRYYRAVAG